MHRSHRVYGWLSVFFAMLGIVASTYLTRHHYLALKAGFTGQSFCNINSYLNCDLVLSSRYATLGTLPLGGLGLLFYIYLLGALIYARLAPERSAKILLFPLLLVMGSLVLSLFLAYVSFYQLHSLCIFCSSLYLINLSLFFVLNKTVGLSWRERASTFRHEIPWAQHAIAFMVFFGLGALVLQQAHREYSQDLSDAAAEQYFQAFLAQPVLELRTEDRPFWGNAQAAVTVVEFSDFECPHCKMAAFNLKPQLASYQDQVKLVFMNLPLDKSCNPGITRDLHRQACRTAYAAHCAYRQGKFWEFHDEAFRRQPNFSEDDLKRIATKAKLDLPEFARCIDAPETAQSVLRDIEMAQQAKIQGTPAVFVNGRAFSGWTSKKLLRKILEYHFSQH